LFALAVLLAACGGGPMGAHLSASRTPHPTYKIGAPYTVKGATYYPHVDFAYDEIGLASWYGEAFEGQYTANGEVFDLNDLTAAHRTLPLPSIVEIANLQNGRAMRVRINDRGPFADGRIIDVSRRVAQLLGFERSGAAEVRVRILKDDSLQAAAAAQRGIVSNGETALAAATYNAQIAAASPPRSASHRFVVQSPSSRMEIGPVATREEADQLLTRMIESGYRDAHIVID
jgi:rare lipoprotein A